MQDSTPFMADWDEYQAGLDYMWRLNLLATANENERFYAGYHWDGTILDGAMPEITFPIVERVVNYHVSQVKGKLLTMQFSADNAINSTAGEDRIQELRDTAATLTAFSKTTWERLQEDMTNQQGLVDAHLSGTAIVFYRWNEKIPAGDGVMGDMAEELIDVTDYFPGNTSDWRANDENGPLQPYIIISFREFIKAVKKEAQENGVSADELETIVPDDGYRYRSGDRAKDEANESKAKDKGKCTVLLRLWVGENGRIWARRSVKGLLIRKDWDTELKRYPVAPMVWKPRKNSCYGEAGTTVLVKNNIAINKLAASCYYWTMMIAFSRIIYDANRIDEGAISNDFTEAIPITTDNGTGITGAIGYLQPTQGLTPGVLTLLDTLVSMTKEMAGANETALGDNSVTRTATGIMALQKASAMPLAMNDTRFEQWNKDKGLIWEDFWMAKYRKRPEQPQAADRILTVEDHGETKFVPFDASQYDDAAFNLKIDVGASTLYSDIQAYTILMEWVDKKLITFREGLERIQSFNIVPDIEGLLKDIDAQDEDKLLLYMMMAQYVASLPPEIQAQLEQLRQTNPEQYETTVKQLILQTTGGEAQNGLQNMPVATDGGQGQNQQRAR